MNMLKDKYRQFRQWQEQPFDYHDTHEHHGCCNCGAESENNYCPRCGQKAVYGPITWRSVWQGVMDVWGVGTRSLPYTLWQLMWRPGYLIRDYISGKRQVSFPPVKMLVIVAVFIYFVGKWIFPEFWEQMIESEPEASTETGVLYYLETVTTWLSCHIEWAFLALFSFLIIPTWIVFRQAPDYPRHSLPQGFFIQVFMTAQFFMWIFIASLVLKLFQVNDVEAIMPAIVFTTIFLILLIDYHQLFGYGWWGTLWRIFAMVAIIYLLLFFIALPLAISYKMMNGVEIKWGDVAIKAIGITVFGFILISAVDAINRGVRKESIMIRKHKILVIATVVTVLMVIDAILGFKFLSSVMGYFKNITEVFANS